MKKTGHRIWYGIAIILSGLVLLLSVAGIAGTWIAENALSKSVGKLLDNLINVTQTIQVSIQSFDQKLASMQDITTAISQASTTLGQQVADQGLIATLLPEEQTTKLSTLAASVQEAITNIKDTLSAVQAIYQTIDQLPFINLPKLNQEQIDKLEQSVTTIQTTVDDLKSSIEAFRSGASEQISKVTNLVSQLGSTLGNVRSSLADLDARLTNTQARLTQLKQAFPTLLIILSVIGSLFLAFVAYSQVEVIRLYVQRWKAPALIETIASPTEQPIPPEIKSAPEAEPQSMQGEEKKD